MIFSKIHCITYLYSAENEGIYWNIYGYNMGCILELRGALYLTPLPF